MLAAAHSCAIESQSESCSNIRDQMTVYEAPPPEVGDLAQACVRFVHDALGLTLDYTPETLPILDHYLREGGRTRQELIDLLTPAAGAYFGEVVRRHMPGARWHSPAGDYAGYRLEFAPFFLCFNPLGVAREVLTQRAAEGWGAHFQVLDDARERVRQSLESTPVAPEDYYTLSVRLEALEQIGDLLTALESTQKERRTFGPDVYRAASGEPAGGGRPS